jgi:hypothetical protein
VDFPSRSNSVYDNNRNAGVFQQGRVSFSVDLSEPLPISLPEFGKGLPKTSQKGAPFP